jgi:hypothetical protein
MVAIMINKFNTDWPFYSSMIINVVSAIIPLVIGLILTNIITYVITEFLIKPLSNYVQMISAFDFNKKYDPRIIPYELVHTFNIIEGIYTMYKYITKWLPEDVRDMIQSAKHKTQHHEAYKICLVSVSLKNQTIDATSISNFYKVLDTCASQFYKVSIIILLLYLKVI